MEKTNNSTITITNDDDDNNDNNDDYTDMTDLINADDYDNTIDNDDYSDMPELISYIDIDNNFNNNFNFRTISEPQLDNKQCRDFDFDFDYENTDKTDETDETNKTNNNEPPNKIRCSSEPISIYSASSHLNPNDDIEYYNNLILAHNEHLFYNNELSLSKLEKVEILEILCNNYKENNCYSGLCPVVFCKCKCNE